MTLIVCSRYLVSTSDVSEVEPSSNDHESKPGKSEGVDVASAGAVEKRPVEEADKESFQPKKKRNRGQNKQRDKFSNQRSARNEKLCKAIICDTVCSYGDSCKFSHDVVDFMSKKPADLPGECYNFTQFGRCPYGFACRFAKTHVQERDGKFCNIVNEDTVPSGKSVNHLSKDNLVLLRKNKYNFSKAADAFKDAKKVVDKIAKRNFELRCVKKGKGASDATEDQPPNGQTEGSTVEDQPLNVETESSTAEHQPPSAEASSDCIPLKSPSPETVDLTCDHTSVSESEPAVRSKVEPVDGTDNPVGALTNEDEFKIKPGEKKTIDFRNKLYLAPLTTVSTVIHVRHAYVTGCTILLRSIN